MNEALKRKQKQRIEYLNKIYELADGFTEKVINGAEVGAQIGLVDGDEAIIRNITSYLEGEGLIRVDRVMGGFPGWVRLTHNGVKEIEDALENPDKPTQHFMPINILNVGQMYGSNIQQGTINSNQSLNISSDAISEIKRFMSELSQSLNDLSLNKDGLDELKAECATLQAQVESPKPKVSILKECLSSAKSILESASGSAIGAQLATQIPQLLVLL
ncbi:hypothetical protein ACEV8B_21925 [Vibrio parahaemolyticus]|uniref:hypothetical protein n=3 Tax=Vibrio parahaemolyticus TaxID=670 RepID=UPI0023622F58|nr:hypothetical protein [Vibrio parahaemolyticus]ELA9340265.1 hypothetical protein [Vibrio parahaemolyticus]HCG5068642.1 hypothetical protein [Vibrio parahaemolyticus]HCG8058721.1 hypothetical protein [Vibrio parahaemolyticus]